METIFAQRGDVFHPIPKAGLIDNLPPITFTVKQEPTGAYFLNKIESFELPNKRYGDNDKTCGRILRTFQDRKKPTGILLSGEKGSGKSLLAKTVSVRAAVLGMPSIVINEPHCGEGFNQFIQTIIQPAIVMFDEFEKVYDKDDQEKILTLLDGMYPTNKMYVFTVNDKYRIDSHMRNRPGRVFYALDFTGLTKEFIIDFCDDRLHDKSQIDSVVKASFLFKDFNFDMLNALVEEMNRYSETAQESVAFLNIKPEFEGAAVYKIQLRLNAESPELADENISDKTWTGNPLNSDSISIEYYTPKKRKDTSVNVVVGDDDDNWHPVKFMPKDLKKMDHDSGAFEFVNEAGAMLSLSRELKSSANYFHLL